MSSGGSASNMASGRPFPEQPAACCVLSGLGVLQEADKKGIYTAGTTLAVDDSRLIAWLTEAAIHARANRSAPLKDLFDSPSLFPFRLKPTNAENLVAASSGLDILRHGLDDELVMLRKPSTKNILKY